MKKKRVKLSNGQPVPVDWYNRHKPVTVTVGDLVITIPKHV